MPVRLPDLATSPEAVLWRLKLQPSPSFSTPHAAHPAPSGDSALEPEQQAGGRERIRTEEKDLGRALGFFFPLMSPPLVL